MESLARDCAPPSLVKLLHEKRQAPFRLLSERLGALGCDRKKLRPERPLFPPSDDIAGKELRSEARAFSERISGACQRAFVELIGLDQAEEKADTDEE